MLDQTNANIERHIKIHSVRSDDDRAAVSVLETFLRSNGRINPSFASDDKWPNHDNTFEFVPDPDISRRPKQTFYVQIKGTRNYTEREGVIKYTLKDLAFPAFICDRVSLDPGILFVILNPAERGNERVFWKYMSPNFLNSIDFDFEEEMADEDRKKTIVPFQLAYAVSIHKAQGLEYRSVKVVIPSSNAEKITHGIFYTAITRAKEKLKIYWSSETMQEVVAGFSIDTSRQKSLAIIKEKLKQDKNT